MRASHLSSRPRWTAVRRSSSPGSSYGIVITHDTLPRSARSCASAAARLWKTLRTATNLTLGRRRFVVQARDSSVGRRNSPRREARQGASEPLEDRAGGHGAAGTHRDERGGGVAPFELVQRGRDQARAGGADGMAEGDRAAVDV